MKTRAQRMSLLMGLGCLVMSGCGRPNPYTVAIVEPADGSIVIGSELPVITAVSNGFVLDESAIGGVNERDHGHYALYLDGRKVATAATASVSVDLASLDLVAGTLHVLRAELLNNDRTAVDPPTFDQVEFFLQAEDVPLPTPTPTPPPTGTPTPTPPPTGTPTPLPTGTSTPSPTGTPSPTSPPTAAPTDPPEPTGTVGPTSTESPTAAPTPAPRLKVGTLSPRFHYLPPWENWP